MIKDVSPDTRGVTALKDPSLQQPEAWIFLELAVEMGFDPAAPGPDVEEPAAWDLDAEYPATLNELMTMLQGGAGVDTGFQSDEDRRHDRVSGSDSGDQGEACAAACWDYDVGAAVAVQREGPAESAQLRDSVVGTVDDQAEAAGVGAASG